MPFKYWIVIGALLAGLAVAAGAIGAHVLKKRPGDERAVSLDEAQMTSYETAVRYQLAHGLAIVMVGMLAAQFPAGGWQTPGALFVAGCVLFSGGIYVWLFTGMKPFVHLVPIGGLAWIGGWLSIAYLAWRRL